MYDATNARRWSYRIAVPKNREKSALARWAVTAGISGSLIYCLSRYTPSTNSPISGISMSQQKSAILQPIVPDYRYRKSGWFLDSVIFQFQSLSNTVTLYTWRFKIKPQSNITRFNHINQYRLQEINSMGYPYFLCVFFDVLPWCSFTSDTNSLPQHCILLNIPHNKKCTNKCCGP
jgi:hypothetical protein